MKELTMQEILLDQIKAWEELLEFKKLEKTEIKSKLGTTAKMEKLAKQLELSGAIVELPDNGEVKSKLDKIEKEIKVCKSTIRRLENVYTMYYSENPVEDTEEIEE